MNYRACVCFSSTASASRLTSPWRGVTEINGEAWSVTVWGGPTPTPTTAEYEASLGFLVDGEAVADLPPGTGLPLYEGSRKVGWATVLGAR